MKAVDVFAAVIGFFRDQLLGDIKDTSEKWFTGKHVQWVITVPAIWDLRAKQFMRDAAKKVRNFPVFFSQFFRSRMSKYI